MSTVAKHRTGMESTGEIHQSEKRTGRDGAPHARVEALSPIGDILLAGESVGGATIDCESFAVPNPAPNWPATLAEAEQAGRCWPGGVQHNGHPRETLRQTLARLSFEMEV